MDASVKPKRRDLDSAVQRLVEGRGTEEDTRIAVYTELRQIVRDYPVQIIINGKVYGANADRRR